MNGIIPNVLSIAGSDPSGGAGIQADLKTFSALGAYGCAAIAALTAQNTVGVTRVLALPPAFLRDQLDTLFSDVRVHAVKVGMLGSRDAVLVVANAMRDHAPALIVVDPVLRASTGASLLDADALEALREELMPLATVITPNIDEAGILLGNPSARCLADARAAAEQLVARGARAALVTGGHLASGEVSVDVLCDGSDIHEFAVPRIESNNTHGTGCTLSSAIAVLLATGCTLPQACRDAQQFVARAIAGATDLRVGQGAGPVHQLSALWADAALGRLARG